MARTVIVVVVIAIAVVVEPGQRSEARGPKSAVFPLVFGFGAPLLRFGVQCTAPAFGPVPHPNIYVYMRTRRIRAQRGRRKGVTSEVHTKKTRINLQVRRNHRD